MFNRTLGLLGRYRRALLIALGVLLIIMVTTHHLGSSPAGLSPAESATKTQSAGIGYIARHPLNTPHRITVLAIRELKPKSTGALRLASYLFALVFAAAFYYMARSWFGRTVGLLSTLVFCLSPFFLIPARTASAEILFFWPLALMAVYHWLNKTERINIAWFVLILAAGAAFYTPGMIWLLVGAVVICRKKLLAITGELPQSMGAAGLLLLVLLLLPAVLAGFRDWHIISDIAAIPASWPGPLKLIENIGWMISALAAKMPYHDPQIVGRLPYLDLLQLGLLVFGAYAMYTAARNKALAFGAAMLLSVLLAAINNDVEFLLIGLPSAGIFMAAGLRYLYIEWRSVFPRNPIPKSLALLLMSVLVGIQLVYGVSYSLVAWPHTADTKATYVLK